MLAAVEGLFASFVIILCQITEQVQLLLIVYNVVAISNINNKGSSLDQFNLLRSENV